MLAFGKTSAGVANSNAIRIARVNALISFPTTALFLQTGHSRYVAESLFQLDPACSGGCLILALILPLFPAVLKL